MEDDRRPTYFLDLAVRAQIDFSVPNVACKIVLTISNHRLPTVTPLTTCNHLCPVVTDCIRQVVPLTTAQRPLPCHTDGYGRGVVSFNLNPLSINVIERWKSKGCVAPVLCPVVVFLLPTTGHSGTRDNKKGHHRRFPTYYTYVMSTLLSG